VETTDEVDIPQAVPADEVLTAGIATACKMIAIAHAAYQQTAIMLGW
jgi:hypothetical protein